MYNTSSNVRYYYVNLATGKSQWEKPQGGPGGPGTPPPYSGPAPQQQQRMGGGGGPGTYPSGPQQPYYPQQPQGYYPSQPQPMYGGYPPQPAQQPVVAQQAPQKQSRMGGMGGVALGAGAGLLGGYLLADALTPDQTVVENNYYGDDGGYGGGDGGDFGGGDF
jgi:hypothetical protein